MSDQNNKISELIRRSLDQSKRAREEARFVSSKIEQLQQLLGGSSFKALSNRDRALAAARDMRPSWFVVEHGVDEAGTAADQTEKQVDTVGRFIVERIRVAWRASDGSDVGKFGHGSSGVDPDLTSSNVVDFSFELVDGRNSLHLQNRMIPGDLFFRSDSDGYVPGGLVLAGGTDFKVIVTPHRAWPSDGYVIFVLEGIQVYDQVGAP